MALMLLLITRSSNADDELPLVPFPSDMLPPISDHLEVSGATLPQLRSILVSANASDRLNAGKVLVQSGDHPTIQRLVYAMKQGNTMAAEILHDSASLHVIPYLLEDVAHGSMKLVPGYSLNPYDRLRVTATEIMSKTLAVIPGLPDESIVWLVDMAGGGGGSGGLEFMFVPEKSKALLDWWGHNGEAVLAGRANEATWLPAERKLTPRIFEAWREVDQAKPPLPPPPPPTFSQEPWSPLPLRVDEPFESWAKRIVDPKLRDVTWATVDFETGSSVRLGVSAIDPSERNGQLAVRGDTQTGSPSVASPNGSAPTRDVRKAPHLVAPWHLFVVMIIAAIGILWLVLKRRR